MVRAVRNAHAVEHGERPSFGARVGESFDKTGGVRRSPRRF